MWFCTEGCIKSCWGFLSRATNSTNYISKWAVCSQWACFDFSKTFISYWLSYSWKKSKKVPSEMNGESKRMRNRDLIALWLHHLLCLNFPERVSLKGLGCNVKKPKCPKWAISDKIVLLLFIFYSSSLPRSSSLKTCGSLYLFPGSRCWRTWLTHRSQTFYWILHMETRGGKTGLK